MSPRLKTALEWAKDSESGQGPAEVVEQASKEEVRVAGLECDVAKHTLEVLLPEHNKDFLNTIGEHIEFIEYQLELSRAQHSKTEREHRQMAACIIDMDNQEIPQDDSIYIDRHKFRLTPSKKIDEFADWLTASAERYSSVKNAGGG